MNWFVLALAGLLEIVWAIGLKHTHGFTRLTPSIITLLAMGASVWLLGLAMRTIPLGSAYAVWVGIGAVGAAIAGVVLFNEPINALKVVSLMLVVTGIVGLKLAAGSN